MRHHKTRNNTKTIFNKQEVIKQFEKTMFDQKQENLKTYQIILQNLIIVMKICYHYIDLVTDILMTKLYFDLYLEEKNEGDNFWLTAQWMANFVVSAFLLLLDRLSTFNFMLQVYKKVHKYETGITLKCKIKMFLVTFLYLEYVYIGFIQQTKKIDIRLLILKKSFIQLYTENVIFTASSMVVTVRFMIDGKKITSIVLFSLLTSIMSASYIQYQFYLERYRQQAFLIQKQDKKFQEFSLEAQIFIANPFYIGGLKQNSMEIMHYPEFFRELVQDKYLVDLSPPQKVYIFCCMFLSLLIMSSLLTMSWISVFRIDGIFGVITGIILTSPQYITYLRLSLKKCQNKKERSQAITKFLLGIPIYGLSGIMLFLIKLTSEKLPLLPCIQESWTINFYPSWYDYFIKQICSTLWISSLGYILDTAKFHTTIVAQFQVKNQENFDRIQSPDSLFRQIYNYMIAVYCLVTILNIIYFLEFIDRNYINKKKYDDYQKIEEENLIAIQFAKCLKEMNPEKLSQFSQFCETQMGIQLPIKHFDDQTTHHNINNNYNNENLDKSSAINSNYPDFKINEDQITRNQQLSAFMNSEQIKFEDLNTVMARKNGEFSKDRFGQKGKKITEK